MGVGVQVAGKVLEATGVAVGGVPARLGKNTQAAKTNKPITMIANSNGKTFCRGFDPLVSSPLSDSSNEKTSLGGASSF
jgi:hypothetical protein